MKKAFRIVATLVLCSVMLWVGNFAMADAGSFSGNSDYGGGTGSGSGWSESGSNFFFSGGGGSDGLDLETIGIVIIIVIVVIFFMNRKNKGDGPSGGGSSGGSSTGQMGGDTPSSGKSLDLKVLKEKDSRFSEQAFLEKVSNLYVQMQNAWQDKNWTPMRPYMTDALYSQFERQLLSIIREKQTNYIERIAVLGTRILSYTQDQVNDTLTVELRVRIVDYTLHDETGNLISGSKTQEKFMTYAWTLIRSKGKMTDEREDVKQVHCTNCGAPVAVNHSGQCEFCGSVLSVDDYGWVISSIRGISQTTR